MKSDPGKKWPWIIVGSILAVVGLVYWTVSVAINNPVQLSDLDMQEYHHFERDANALIKAKIAFDKKYDIEYVTDAFKTDGAVVKYKVSTKAGDPVNDANVTVKLTRPNTHDFDRYIGFNGVKGGIYSFDNVTLPKAGRWDILARIQVGDDVRYLNLKADTRYPNVFEF